MKKAVLIALLALTLTACAGPNPLEGVPDRNGNVAGFWNGLWDGWTAPIALMVSWFNDDVEIYNPNSNGWYPLGFMLGVGGLSGSSASVSRKSKK